MIANYAAKGRLIKKFYAFFLILFLLIFFAVHLFTEKIKELDNRIYPNVYVDNVAVGHMLPRDAAKMLQKNYSRVGTININIVYEGEKIATLSGQNLNLRTNLEEKVIQAYDIGRTPLPASRILQKISAILKLRRYDFQTEILYDRENLDDFIASAEDKYDKPAKNALFSFENNRVASFRQEEKGLKIMTDNFYIDFNKAVKDIKFNPVNKNVVLRSREIKPDITLAQANSFGIEEYLGEGKSDYTHSIPSRIHNVIVGASKFNGILIPKGREFSFNDTIGDISAVTGYQPAYIIKNGRTVLGDGGGVCQVSTTLFRAALNIGLPIVERHAHDYRVGYYENDSKPGFDATVFAPSTDLKILNDTPASILIQTQVDEENNLLYFRLYGKKDGRRSEISDAVVYDVTPALADVRQDDPTMKKGQIKQVDFAAPGTKARFTYKVYKNGSKVVDTSFFSNYRPWAAVYLVGTAD